MKRVVRHKRIECVSCALCAEEAPAYWRMDEDGLAVLVQVEKTRGAFTFTPAFPQDVPVLKEMEAACPAGIIRVL